ncbi:serine/threonine kinase [Aureococcus anophagefferens]|nr:serine/threonine kinase [Aureococcus anophagefferens]
MESISLSPAFTPLPGLVGGALIGAICIARLHALGRLSGLATDTLFVPGLVLGGAYAAFRTSPDAFVEGTTLPTWRLLLAGALVGVGVPMGKGCTARRPGPRLPLGRRARQRGRVHAGRGGRGDVDGRVGERRGGGRRRAAALGAAAGAAGVLAMRPLRRAPPVADLVAGAAFACALALSGMTKASKVLGFLEPTRRDGWDPTLACVMGGAVCVSLPGVAFGKLLAAHPHVQRWARRDVEPATALGGLLFGAGWGLAGACPCPALAAAGVALFQGQALAPACVFAGAMLATERAYAAATAAKTKAA